MMITPGKEIKGTHGKYHLLYLLTLGGMAEIWLAKQTDREGKERIVVVKTIRSDLVGQQKYDEMFLDEIRISSRFDHPNLVHIIEKGKLKGNYFLIMEYLDGESLAYLVGQAVKKGRRFPQELAASIFAQACDGLGHAHNLQDAGGKPMNIIHRDVSPGNIIVLFSGRVKLIDFGIAAASERVHETRTGVTKGKLSYMSPEQCQGNILDVRTDIFSLGTILWEMLSGRRLFKHSIGLHTMRAIASGDVPSIRDLRPDVSRELESIVMRALQTNPKDRYASMERMSEALKLFLSNRGATVSEYQISEFYLEVSPDRINTKKRLIEELISKEAGSKELAALKLDTDASMPSSPAIAQDEDPDGSEDTETSEVVMDADGTPKPVIATPPKLPDYPAREEPPQEEEEQEEEQEEAAAQKESLDTMKTAVEKRPAPPGDETAPKAPSREISQEGISPPPDEKPARKIKPIAVAIVAVVSIAIVAVIVFSSSERESLSSDVVSVPVLPEKPDADPAPKPPDPEPPELPKPARDAAEPAGKKNEAPAKTPAKITPPKKDKPVSKPKKRPASRIKKFGFLRLNTDPWCEVYLGKRKLGITPLLGVKLPKGDHKLRLVNKDMGIDKILPVNIRPGKTTSLTKKLDGS